MLNITGKFVTVFDPLIKLDKSEKTIYATLSTSKKTQRQMEQEAM